MKNITPIRRQYLEIKARHQDSILLFRLGDFYEAFDDDAKLLADELDITLTTKPMGKDIRVPLAGIPHYVLEKHLATLISRGHRVAICEQTSAAPVKGRDGKKLIKREVVRVVTAGTVIEPELLESKSNNYLAAFFSDGENAGIAYADISTGEFSATEINNRIALAELQRLAPAEILITGIDPQPDFDDLTRTVVRLDPDLFEYKRAKKTILSHFGSNTLKPYGLNKKPLAVAAAGALLSYLQRAQGDISDQLTRLTSYDSLDYMLLDRHTLRSLEIFQSDTNNSLITLLDHTLTPMGGRLLRSWLRQPLLDTAEIYRRQDYISWFLDNRKELERLRALLENVKDLQRLSSRAKANYISAAELLSFGQSLELIPRIKNVVRKDPVKFGRLLAHLPDCRAVAELIGKSVSGELPTSQTEQIGIIRDGYSAKLDNLRRILKKGKEFLAELEKREKKRTGIKSLRVGFNKVFGYYIEVTKPNLHLVPKEYMRKQTLVPCERFITLELKEHESLVIHTQERISELENNLFRQICAEIGKNRPEILLAASTIAQLDAITSLALMAAENDYVRPVVNETSLLRIKHGRHPTIETTLREQKRKFVGNDAALGGNGAPQIALITGPNASGKSTYLRQVALIVILAQIGSFVPAAEAVIGLCDRIFTRIGLYDRIGSGESTFMTEMIETAEILHHATPRSLILLDELGRGTSTYDGLAVARSVLEFLHNHPKLQTRTLFATHYHELAELEQYLPKLENFYFEIEEYEERLIFKYRLGRGTAMKSYGVYAAEIAGLPRPVVKRAKTLLEQYEATEQKAVISASKHNRSVLEKALAEIDTDNLSPVEALMKLYELKKLSADGTKDLAEGKKAVG